MLIRKWRGLLLIMVVAVVLVSGCASDSQGLEEEPAPETLGNREAIENHENDRMVLFGKEVPEVVAVINGQEIRKEQLVKDYRRMKTLYESVGIETEDEHIQEFMREMLMNDLRNTTLLVQEADRLEITVSPELVAEEVEQAVASFETEKAFYDMLSDLDMTLEEFEAQMSRQLKIHELLRRRVAEVLDTGALDFEDDEIETMYGIISERLGDMPDYSEMAPTVRYMVNHSKAQVIIGDLLTQLTNASEIEFYF